MSNSTTGWILSTSTLIWTRKIRSRESSRKQCLRMIKSRQSKHSISSCLDRSLTPRRSSRKYWGSTLNLIERWENSLLLHQWRDLLPSMRESNSTFNRSTKTHLPCLVRDTEVPFNSDHALGKWDDLANEVIAKNRLTLDSAEDLGMD